MIQSLAHEMNFDKGEAGAGEKTSETVSRKIFDALSGPGGEGGIKNGECRHEFHELARI